MGKAKGKVNEKSLDNLKKKLKAGGDRKKEQKAKPATPRSRSRSRTPGRPRKATPPPPKKKEPAPRKSRKNTAELSRTVVKVKRLDDKPSSSAKKSTASRRSKVAARTPENSVKPYKLRSRAAPVSSDHEISSSTKIYEDDLSTSQAGGKGSAVKGSAVNGTSGWLSKCVIV